MSTKPALEVNIRKADVFDISDIIAILHEWTLESPYECFGKVCAATGTWVANVIRNNLFLVVECESRIIGAAALCEHRMPWDNDASILNVEFIMILKQYRKTGAAVKLIDTLKDIATKCNKPLTMGINQGVDVKKKDRFMRMNGFMHIGGNYLFGV